MEQFDDGSRDHGLRLRSFFAELKPRLDAAKALDTKFDRELAHRFNVLDYLDTRELGLSRIIADLLDPKANHGQGSLFLRTLLGMLKPRTGWPDLDVDEAKVTSERVIEEQRRIDIKIDIPDSTGSKYCLAIENKPYAADQDKQIVNYLKYLAQNAELDGRFLLIYLSSDGRPPSEQSLPKTGREGWSDHFVIMPYEAHSYGKEAEDEYEDFRLDFGLTNWLSTCREKCDAERLRWFLRDAVLFCQRTFGDHHMTSGNETRQVIDFLKNNQDHLTNAWAVHNAWPDMSDYVCERFLRHLGKIIQRKANAVFPELPSGLFVDVAYERKLTRKTWRHGVSLSGRRWRRYPNPAEPGQTQTCITLNNSRDGPWGWGIGVCSPTRKEIMRPEYKQRRIDLEQKLADEFLHGRVTDRWPRWEAVKLDVKMTDWRPLVPELHRECESGGGRVTDYYVDNFIYVARKAVPMIDEIEREPE